MLSDKTVLIADDDPLLLQAMALRCRALGGRVVTAANGVEALRRAQAEPPDLMILDINMPLLDGLQVCEGMAGRPGPRLVPIIVLSGRSDEQALSACDALRVHHVLKGHRAWETVRAIIAGLFPAEEADAGEAPSGAPKVLLVDDDRDLLRALGTRLRASGLEVVQAANGVDAYWKAVQERPDVVVTDCTMPGGNGEYLLARLRADESTEAIPVVILTGWEVDGRLDLAHERQMTSRFGAAAYLRKPIDFAELLATLLPLLRRRGGGPPGWPETRAQASGSTASASTSSSQSSCTSPQTMRVEAG